MLVKDSSFLNVNPIFLEVNKQRLQTLQNVFILQKLEMPVVIIDHPLLINNIARAGFIWYDTTLIITYDYSK